MSSLIARSLNSFCSFGETQVKLMVLLVAFALIPVAKGDATVRHFLNQVCISSFLP